MSNVLFGHPDKTDDQQDELQLPDNEWGHRYLPLYTCVCVRVSVYVLRVQFSPVTRTALIQMNSTLCAKVSARCNFLESIFSILYKFFFLLFVQLSQLSLSIFFSSFFIGIEFILNATKSVSNGEKNLKKLCV